MAATLLLDDLEAEPKPTVARLGEIYARHHQEPRFCQRVVEAIGSGDPDLERCGAWLLRRHVKAGQVLAAGTWADVIDGFAGLKTWEGQLLMCQLLGDRPELMDTAPDAVADFLRNATEHKTPFLRAWAITAFVALGRRHKKFATEARRRLAVARKDPTASVKARLRHLLR